MEVDGLVEVEREGRECGRGATHTKELEERGASVHTNNWTLERSETWNLMNEERKKRVKEERKKERIRDRKEEKFWIEGGTRNGGKR